MTTGLLRTKFMIKRFGFGVVAALMLAGFPGPVLLSSNVAADSSCSPVAAAPAGTSRPTGSAAGTYHYDSCTGLWANDHYTFSPSTRQYTALQTYPYVCNTSTWSWQTQQWNYIASQHSYALQTVNANPPAGSVSGTCVKPAPAPAPVSSPSPQVNTAGGGASASGGSTLSGSNSNNANENDNTNVSLTNNVNSDAESGDVNMSRNTVSGNATSGNALASAQIINSVNSSSSLTGGQVVTFTKNINGDVNGDIMINANDLQPSNVNLNNNNNLTLNTQESGTINNNVTLNAKSGDVTASENTKAGNATSGNAAAMANIMNMLNSYVSAGQSFIGTININGNLHGNILMPPTFLNSLAASGAPHTTVTLSNTNTTNLTDTSTTSIINQINSQAASGNVTQSQNTKAGNATSGNASTAVEVYNLTGRQIVGANGLLVFVNVMGTWVGVIVNAPTGSHSALLGGNVTENTSNNTSVSATTNNTINNNINVAAQSGNVTSSKNTTVGNATSGNASTSVDLANLTNDSLSYSGWFGILFINVFGSWYGNFGALPAKSDLPTRPYSAHSSGKSGKYSSTSQQVFQFAAKNANSGANDSANSTNVTSSTSHGGNAGSGSNGAADGSSDFMLTSASIANKVAAANPSASQIAQRDKFTKNGSTSTQWLIVSGALVLAGVVMFASTARRNPEPAKSYSAKK